MEENSGREVSGAWRSRSYRLSTRDCCNLQEAIKVYVRSLTNSFIGLYDCISHNPYQDFYKQPFQSGFCVALEGDWETIVSD